jgi:hypothetical protein
MNMAWVMKEHYLFFPHGFDTHVGFDRDTTLIAEKSHFQQIIFARR